MSEEHQGILMTTTNTLKSRLFVVLEAYASGCVKTVEFFFEINSFCHHKEKLCKFLTFNLFSETTTRA